MRARLEGWAMGAWLYILQCADGSYYVGTTRSDLETRVSQHNAGTFGGYTAMRLPLTLAYSNFFDHVRDAIAAERQIKRWTRAKKEALIRGDFVLLKALSQRVGAHGSRRAASQRSSP